jgi:hypothetical protein
VLFSGRSRMSEGIKWATFSEWSHVGMVVYMPPGSGPLADTVLLWESTTVDNLKDVLDGVTRCGVQLVLLSDRIQSYPGSVALRRLSVHRDPAMFDALAALRLKLRQRPFEESRLELMRAAFDGPFDLVPGSEDLTSLFCSELVAEAYQAMGLLAEHGDGRASNEYTPQDFAGDLPLLRGAVLGPIVQIK